MTKTKKKDQKPLVKTRQILLVACQAYIRSQRRQSFKKHSREEITTAWLEVDNILMERARRFKGDE